MCVPGTYEKLAELGRRDFLKLASAALGGVAAAAAPIATHAASSKPLSGVAQVARPGGLRYQNMLDLTHPLSSAFPVFPAFQPLALENVFTHEAHGFYANKISMPEHCGTHMDAPLHFAAGTMSVAEIPISNLFIPAVVVDISERAATNPDAQLTVDDLRQWERGHGRIPQGAAVLMYSGWESRVGDPEAFLNIDNQGVMHFPGFHPEAADFLLEERDVTGIGVDTISLDYGPSADFAVHYRWLATNRWGLEGLANLSQIPTKRATLFVAPVKLAQGSGATTRVVAMW